MTFQIILLSLHRELKTISIYITANLDTKIKTGLFKPVLIIINKITSINTCYTNLETGILDSSFDCVPLIKSNYLYDIKYHQSFGFFQA